MHEQIFLIIQIIAESLPISSSAHCQLAEHVACQMHGFSYESISFPSWLAELAHGPMLLIVVILFTPACLGLARGLFQGLFPFRAQGFARSMSRKIVARIFLFGFVASSVTLAEMFVLKQVTIGHSEQVLLCGLIATSCMLLSLGVLPISGWNMFEQCGYLSRATIVGIAQGLATLPGISRFASTYVALRWMGLTPRRAFQTSFLLAIPIYLVGFARGLNHVMSCPDDAYLVGPFVTLVGSLLSLCALFLVSLMVQREKIWFFGIYMFFPIALQVILMMTSLQGSYAKS